MISEQKEAWVKQYRQDELKPVPGIKGKFKRYANPSKPGQRLISGLGRLEPGEDMGWHSHPEEEAFTVISGKGLVRWKINDQIFEAEISPGFSFYKEGGVPHQMVNTGDEPMVGVVAKVKVENE
jgi:quercetin dioxygenase-like cupin family protein